MLYVPLAIGLTPYPPPQAMALTVVVVETVIGPVYWVDAIVGVEPSVV